jgi:hypothetical protein
MDSALSDLDYFDSPPLEIQPKSATADERTQVRQVLRAAGIPYEPGWEPPAPVSPEARTRLAQRLGRIGPLSEVIIADRGDRA